MSLFRGLTRGWTLFWFFSTLKPGLGISRTGLQLHVLALVDLQWMLNKARA
jgi:hypothetical protein